MTTYLPFTFHCYECDTSHALTEGNYIFEDDPEVCRAKDTKFYCIPCARHLFGDNLVNSVLEGAP